MSLPGREKRARLGSTARLPSCYARATHPSHAGAVFLAHEVFANGRSEEAVTSRRRAVGREDQALWGASGSTSMLFPLLQARSR
jgi:hypothetical protein